MNFGICDYENECGLLIVHLFSSDTFESISPLAECNITRKWNANSTSRQVQCFYEITNLLFGFQQSYLVVAWTSTLIAWTDTFFKKIEKVLRIQKDGKAKMITQIEQALSTSYESSSKKSRENVSDRTTKYSCLRQKDHFADTFRL